MSDLPSTSRPVAVTATKPDECAGCRAPIVVGQEIAPAPYRRWIHATDECEAKARERFMPVRRRNPAAYARSCPACPAEPDGYCVTDTGKKRPLHPERIAAAQAETEADGGAGR